MAPAKGPLTLAMVLRTPFPAVAFGVAVAELQGLVGAGAGAGRYRGGTDGAVGQRDMDLDSGIAPRVEDLPTDNAFDDAHPPSLPRPNDSA